MEKIILTSKNPDLAEELFIPIQKTITDHNDGDADDSLIIEWDEIQIKRGVADSLIQLVGNFDLVAFSIGVASSLLANLIWELTKKAKSLTNKKNEIEVRLINEKANTEILITSASKEDILESIKGYLEKKNEIS